MQLFSNLRVQNITLRVILLTGKSPETFFVLIHACLAKSWDFVLKLCGKKPNTDPKINEPKCCRGEDGSPNSNGAWQTKHNQKGLFAAKEKMKGRKGMVRWWLDGEMGSMSWMTLMIANYKLDKTFFTRFFCKLNFWDE